MKKEEYGIPIKLKRCLIILLFAVGFSVLFFQQCAEAATVTYGICDKGKGKWRYKVIDQKKKYVAIRPKCLGDVEATVKIPNTIKGQDGKTVYKVTKIADNAFYNCACEECSGITSLEKQWKKEEMDDVVGYCCSDFNKVNIPSNCTSIGYDAFCGCELTSLIFDGSAVKTIGDCAFEGNELKSIKIPASCTSIGEYAFDGNQLTSVIFAGNAVKTIGDYAFDENDDIGYIYLPDSITKLGKKSLGSARVLVSDLNMWRKVYHSGVVGDDIGFKRVKLWQYIYNEYDDCIEKKVMKEYTWKPGIKITYDAGIPKGYFLTGIWCDEFNKNQQIEVKWPGSPEIDIYKFCSACLYQISYTDGVHKKLALHIPPSILLNYFKSYFSQCHVIWDNFIQNYDLKNYDLFEDYCVRNNYLTNIYRYTDPITLENYPDEFSKKIGYKFVGWNINGTAKKPGVKVSGLTINNNYDIKPKWDPIKYKIKYDANGGSGDMDDTSCKYDERGELRKNSFTKDGYIFKGWSIEKDSKKVIYCDEKVIKNLTDEDGKEITLYAIWRLDGTEITFNTNGGVISGSSTKLLKKGQVYGTLPSASKTGYDFDGWYTSYYGGQLITSSTVLCYGNDFTVYAHWKAKKVKVSFFANGGILNGNSSSQVDMGKIVGIMPTVTKKNYEFVGWFTSVQGGTQITPVTKVNTPLNCYVRWKLTDKRKKITIKVRPKNKGKVKGYRIEFGMVGGSASFTQMRSSSKKALTITLKNVKIGKKYYARACSYQIKRGKKVWSKYGAKKVVAVS